MRSLGVMCVGLFLSACALPGALSLEKGNAPIDISAPSPKGFVYIYRERNFSGSARGLYIQANGVRVGGVNNGTYFIYLADPGPLTISAEDNLDSNNGPKRTLNINARQRYYVRASLVAGAWDAAPHLELVESGEGEQAVQALSYETLRVH